MLRFNGAAFSRTRKRVGQRKRRELVLRFNGAAFSRTRKQSYAVMGTTTDIQLQWGRVLTNAETWEWARRLRDARNTLQWGRVLTNAETPCIPVASDRGDVELQWGRVLTNAETGAVRSGALVSPRASMGPRSHERGNADGRHRDAGQWNELQWGRVLTNAETASASAAYPTTITRFNGAAFSTNAETGPARPICRL